TTTVPAVVDRSLARFDTNARSLKLRLSAANPQHVLRADMLVDVSFPVRLPEATPIPVHAGVGSGLRHTVCVERSEGIFEPRSVEVGWRAGGRVQILRGLNPGESIVVSGNFLLDSESRMRHGDAGGHD